MTIRFIPERVQRKVGMFCALALLAGALSVPFPAAAQRSCRPNPGGGMCPAPTAAAGASESGVYAGAGNPINVITGNKYQREEDMPALPGELGLEIVRYYNSANSEANGVIGLVGRGWTLSYETELYVIGDSLQIIQADGVRVIFNRDPRNRSLCSTDNPANGSVSIEPKRDGDEYTWTAADGRKLHFNRDGKLVQILAPSGAFVSLQYDARGLLVKVTDPEWRSLHLIYPDKAGARRGDQFSGVQSIDTPVGRFSYEYGSALPKGAVAAPKVGLASLVRVRIPTAYDPAAKPHPRTSRGTTVSTLSRIYHYEDARFPTLLTGISIASAKPAKTERYATYGYDSNGRASLSTHPGDAGKVTLDYSEAGKTVLTNSLGQQTVYRHAVIGGEYRLLEVRGPGCASCGETNVRYGYDPLGRLAEHSRLAADGSPIATTRIELDGLGRAVKVFRIGYKNGRTLTPLLVERNIYEGDSFQAVLSARPSVASGKELTQRMKYNARGQLASLTESGWAPSAGDAGAAVPIARTTTYLYALINNRSVLVQIDGPLPNGTTGTPADSDITRIEYDRAGGHIVRVTAPGNVITDLTADDYALRPSRIRRSDGVRVVQADLERAPNGQMLGVVETAWRLDGARAVEGSRLTRSERFLYDPHGRLVAHNSPGGIITRFAYAHGEQPSHVIAPDNSQVVTGFDTEGRKTEQAVFGPGGERSALVSYQSFSDQLRAIDQHASIRSFQAGPAGGGQHFPVSAGTAKRTSLRQDINLGLIEQEWTSASSSAHASYYAGPPGSVAEPFSERVIRTDGTEVRRWFDDFLRVVATRSSERGLRTALYSEAGHVRSLNDARGITTRVARDPAGRVRQVEFVAADGRAGTRIDYRYEGMVLAEEQRWENGKLDNKTVWSSDVWGQVSGRKLQISGASVSSAPVAMSINNVKGPHGRVLRKVLPSGAQLDYRYDAAGRIAAVAVDGKSILEAIGYRQEVGSSNAVDLLYGNGLRAKTERKWDGSLLSHDSGTDKSTFRADPQGNIVGIERQPTGRASRHASLPTARQPALADACFAQEETLHGRTEFAYDQFDRLASEVEEGKKLLDVRYNDGGDRVTAGQEQRDAVGNVISHGAQTFIYGPGGELSVVRDGKNGVLAGYRYDADGVRVAKHTPGSTEFYLYEDKQLIAVADASGRIIAEYVYVGTRPVARLRHFASSERGRIKSLFRKNAPALEYLHADQRNAVEAVTDATGAILWQARLGAFGELGSAQSSPSYMPLRLSGQYADPETGLHYNVHRYYDPARGRYLQSDPVGITAGLNTYAYGGSNPLLKADPFGLDWEPDDSLGPNLADIRPWLFGVFVHRAFAIQIRGRGIGWGADDGRAQTWSLMRPDAYEVDPMNLRLEADKLPFVGKLWELKPVSWSAAVNPGKYAIAQAQVKKYQAGKSRGCWITGSSRDLVTERPLHLDMIPMGNMLYPVAYMPDVAPDTSGLIFYSRGEPVRVPRPRVAPVPALTKEEHARLMEMMAQVQDKVKVETNWLDVAVKGLMILIMLAVAVFLAMNIARMLSTLIMVLGALLVARTAIVAGLAAVFGLSASATTAAELEKKGKEGESGMLDKAIAWFKKWL